MVAVEFYKHAKGWTGDCIRPLHQFGSCVVGLRGIATVAIQLLRHVAERVRPPRALCVPFRHGYPLDRPGSPDRQHAVIEAALRVLERADATPPLLAEL